MTMIEAPRMWFALPGTWVDIPLADDERVGALAAIAEDAGGETAVESFESDVQYLRSEGDVDLMIRVQTDSPAMLFIGWMPAGDAPENLGIRIERHDGYSAHRTDLPTPGSDSTAAEYVVGHPSGGMRCRLRTLVRGAGSKGERLAPYDLLAETITWVATGVDV